MPLRRLKTVLKNPITKMKNNTTEAIYNVLLSAAFEEWNEEVFIPHVEGEENCKSKEGIVKDLEEMLKTYEVL